MKLAVVSGASSGIGREVCARVLTLGYIVIGVSRTITSDKFNNSNFIPIQADLSEKNSTLNLCKSIKEILKTNNYTLKILVNCAGFGKFEPHEELSTKTITDMMFLNLTSPILLSNALLRDLKKNSGYLINITSIEAIKSNKFAALYSATKSGLKAFGDSLFEETRKSELSVTNINPDMTESDFYDNLRFTTSTKEQERLITTDIADAIEHILSMRKGAVVSNYTIRSSQFGISKKRL